METLSAELKDDLRFYEQATNIIDWREHVLYTMTILLFKVLWKDHNIKEATWEP